MYQPQLAFIFSVVFLFLFTWGATSSPAQSEERPIYLYTGSQDQKNFTWTDRPGKATVHVFLESISKGEEGGRLLGGTIAKIKERLLNQAEHYQKATTLETRFNDVYGFDALSTSATYPAKDVRYFLLIEIGEDLYASRTLRNATGNLPRYYALTGEAPIIRVAKVESELRLAAKKVIQRVEQGGERGKSNSDPQGSTSEQERKRTSKPSPGEAEPDEPRSVGVSLSWSDRLGLLADVLYFVVLVVGAAGMILFALNHVLNDGSSEKTDDAAEFSSAEPDRKGGSAEHRGPVPNAPSRRPVPTVELSVVHEGASSNLYDADALEEASVEKEPLQEDTRKAEPVEESLSHQDSS